METTQGIRRAGAIIIAAALSLPALIAAHAGANEDRAVTVMRHASEASPAYGRLRLDVWNDGTNVQLIGLDTEGRIVLAREGTMIEELEFTDIDGIEAMLPAEEFAFDTDGTRVQHRCATRSCALRIAQKAEAVVRASMMGPVEGAREHDAQTVMATMCPSGADNSADAPAPSPALAALGAKAPCKWAAVPTEDLTPTVGIGQSARAVADGKLYGLRQAPWALFHPSGPDAEAANEAAED